MLKKSIFGGVVVLSVIVIVLLAQWYSRNSGVHDLTYLKQDALAYVQPQQIITVKPDYEKKLMADFLEHYFSPWDDKQFAEKKATAIDHLNEFIAEHGKEIYWAENYHPYPATWLPQQIANATLDEVNRKAISVAEVDERLLPTSEPAYYDVHLAGEGYPFDNLQNYRWPANTPLRVIGFSKDGAWVYALTPAAEGWIKLSNIAWVDDKFIQEWRTENYIAPYVDRIPMIDYGGIYRFDTRVGEVFPLIKNLYEAYQIKIAIADPNQHAMIREAQLTTAIATTMPMPANSQTIAQQINRMLGQIYGWGGVFGYRDCASTLHDMFTPFAIWLWGNSNQQGHTGFVTSIADLSGKEKQKMIKEKGIPFFTLLGMHGHVVLYIGQYDQEAIIFHNPWGVRTYDLFKGPGRNIMGRAVITTLRPGKEKFNVFTSIQKVLQTMVVIIPPDELVRS